jgi:hypothetical protein
MPQPVKSTNGFTTLLPVDGVEATETLQLSKLSSVLNGLEGGAQLIHRHMQETMSSIKAGTYRIDPIKLSRRIVGEALRVM